jgi:hypothetical protein
MDDQQHEQLEQRIKHMTEDLKRRSRYSNDRHLKTLDGVFKSFMETNVNMYKWKDLLTIEEGREENLPYFYENAPYLARVFVREGRLNIELRNGRFVYTRKPGHVITMEDGSTWTVDRSLWYPFRRMKEYVLKTHSANLVRYSDSRRRMVIDLREGAPYPDVLITFRD